MFNSHRLTEWLGLPLLRAHLCTLAVALNFNSIWRTPRDAFRYGGLTYGMVLSAAMVIVALPVVLLHLAIGQLSQQDAIGMWKAVPFFKGVGYLRMLVSFLGSIYTSIYVALCLTYLLYSLNNSIPFSDCMEVITDQDEIGRSLNASECLDFTFMSPITEKVEYYLAVALIVVVLWLSFPFMFYSPVKFTKRIYYMSGPIVFLLCISIAAVVGDNTNISSIVTRKDWSNFLQPDIWHAAIVQALLSTQIAGGYLISSGDSVYADTDVQWSAIVIVAVNIIASWISLLFWFGVSVPSGLSRDTGMVAVLIQTYHTAENTGLYIAWPILIFAMMFISGIITMLSFLLPIYDRMRRVGGVKWRMVMFGGSLFGASVALATLVGRIPVFTLMEDTAVPFLISLATFVEILAFIFIYGWKVLVEDIEFLTGSDVSKYWVCGWCAAPGFIASFFLWWTASKFLSNPGWTESPWTASSLATTAAAAVVIFIVFAAVSVWRQEQYDIIGKLVSSFKPSRHWGPQDPITHYHWLARREEVDRGNIPRNRYYRRQPGQLSTRLSIFPGPIVIYTKQVSDLKRRSNSDDWLYTVYRKNYVKKVLQEQVSERIRSRSLNGTVTNVFKRKDDVSISMDTVTSKESNNNIIFK